MEKKNSFIYFRIELHYKRCQSNLTTLFFYVIIYKERKIKQRKQRKQDMKYKLIKPVDDNLSTIEQILTNRGIPLK